MSIVSQQSFFFIPISRPTPPPTAPITDLPATGLSHEQAYLRFPRKNALPPVQSFRIPAYSIRLWLPAPPAIIDALHDTASDWQIKFFWNPRVSPSKHIVKNFQRYIEELKCRFRIILDMEFGIFAFYHFLVIF